MGIVLTPSELIDLVVAKAPQLRKAGVASLDIAGVLTVGLTAYEPEPLPPLPLVGEPDAKPEPEDPLDDPATYGRTESVPGFDVSDTDDDS